MLYELGKWALRMANMGANTVRLYNAASKMSS